MRVAYSEMIARSGFGRLIGTRYRGRGTIFMLHSIVDDTAHYLNQNIRCSTATLELALRWARELDIDIVSLDESVRRLQDPRSRRFVSFTFDDGYRDNITRALPLFERYRAPMTIYVPTHMITGEMYAWWLGLLQLVRDNDSVEVEAMGRTFATATSRAKRQAMNTIARWVHADGTRPAQLAPTFGRYCVDVVALLAQEAMSRPELEAAARHPLITIGGHTVSHCVLPAQSPDVVRGEVVHNKSFLEHITQKPVEHFAYPYGAAGPREAAIVGAAGYRTAVTTANGTVFHAHAAGSGLTALPRETLDQSDTAGCLECRTQGVYRFLKSRGGDPVAHYRAA